MTRGGLRNVLAGADAVFYVGVVAVGTLTCAEQIQRDEAFPDGLMRRMLLCGWRSGPAIYPG
jgi:hypothetical protein